MAKELPYFKFEPNQWENGNIQICSHEEKGVFIDLPRALEKNQLRGFLTACEQIKKGKLYDLRNFTKKWWIDSPSIWVFSNTLVDFDLLSSDRWKIWIISDNELIEIKRQNINNNKWINNDTTHD
jgi:uncharacterized LabA/DUF88 family protein